MKIKIQKTNTELARIKNFFATHRYSKTSKNGWFVVDKLHIYLRCSQRYLDGKYYRTLEIASVKNHGIKSCGGFTRFLEFAESIAKQFGLVVFIENVLNSRFRDFFQRGGYTAILTETHIFSEVVSFYKHIN